MTEFEANLTAELVRRDRFLTLAKRDKELVQDEYELCWRDPKYFITHWCWTYDPREMPKQFPFVLFPFQREAIDWLTERYRKKEKGLIEKSRDMGATWLVAAWVVHRWIFDSSGFTALIGSRKEDLVDDKTMNSFFGKLRYIIYQLPWFLRPAISEKSNTDRYLLLVNPDNNNEIIGESTNATFGRGGRSSICLLDEFAFVERSEEIWTAISDNSNCVIPISTPNGKGNAFGRLKHEGKIPVLSLHWQRHPQKDQAWYESRKKDLQPWQIAQELDLSYEKSARGRVYHRFDRNVHIAKEPIVCNPDFEQFVTWDFGIADPTAILWGQITPDGRVQIYQCFEMVNWDIDFYAPISKGFRPPQFPLCNRDEKETIERALKKIPSNHRDRIDTGDHSGTARTANSKRTCQEALSTHGIKLQTNPKQGYDYRFECLDRLMKLRKNSKTNEWYSILEISPDCHRLIDCLFNYEWDGDNVSDDKLKPKHNWASHMVTALEFFAINRFPIDKLPETRVEKIR